MTTFTPISALIGGAMIGLSAVLLMGLLGRIAGISGIAGGVLRPSAAELPWRLAFAVGLIVAPTVVWLIDGIQPEVRIEAPTVMLIAAGLLVGVGTRVGAGCTSGHGVCGVARLSRRSIVATAVFMTTGGATVFVMRHVLAGF